MLKRLCFALLLAFFTLPAKGQDSISREFSAGFGYGGILPHSEEVRHLARSNPWQLNAEYRMITEKGARRKTPSYGAGIHFIEYRSEVLGSTLALLGFAEPPLFGPVVIRLGCGIGWNSNPYNARTNPANIMFGSTLSGMMQARLSACWQLHPKMRLNYGIGLTHFSNGAWSHPNKGINCFYIFSNAGFNGKKMKGPPAFAEGLHSKEMGWHTTLAASGSITERFPYTGKKYFVWQVQGRIVKQLSQKSQFAAGLDLMHNEAKASFLRDNPEEGSSALLWGVTAGHSWFILPFTSILSEFGYYIYRQNQLYPAMYQRYGLRYHFGRKLAAGVLLKTHKGKAECLEFNILIRSGR
jgi:hypothetical protein